METLLTPEELQVAENQLASVVDNVETVIIGKRPVIELVVIALVAGGHVLLEDVPGVGKTTLVSALAKSVSCGFKRIQFTPDIMPSDVTGFSIFNQKTREFEFRPGGIMSNIVLADEINRASAKTQSALLEAMEERQVTVDGNTYTLEEPFMVLATQNPIEQYGTYPLPEAQIDRFLIKLSIGYPEKDQEVTIIENGDEPKRVIQPVVSSQTILDLREFARQVYLPREITQYIVEIIDATRNSQSFQLGSSPRGGLALASLSRVHALLRGNDTVDIDDVKRLVPYVLGHRVILSHDAKTHNVNQLEVLDDIVSSIAVPASV